MKNRLSLWLLVCALLIGCAAPADLRVVTLKGPTAMGLVYTKAAETMDVLTAPDEVLGKVTSGEVDVAMVPLNMAAVLYGKLNGNVRLLAVTTVGNLYLVGEEPLEEMEALAGKTIISAGQGATPMYVLDFLTQGLDVHVEYLPTHSDVVAAASERHGDYYVLPEPFVTLYLNKVEAGQLVYDLAAAYEERTSHALTMGAVITTTDRWDARGAAMESFLKEYEASVKKVLANPKEAAALIASYGILESAELAEKAVPGAGIVYRTPQESREDVEAFLQLLMEQEPKAVGGQLPGDDFYEAGR